MLPMLLLLLAQSPSDAGQEEAKTLIQRVIDGAGQSVANGAARFLVDRSVFVVDFVCVPARSDLAAELVILWAAVDRPDPRSDGVEHRRHDDGDHGGKDA